MEPTKLKTVRRRRRKAQIRRQAFGLPNRPRLAVFRSGKHIYAQVIDDTSGRTLAAASTRDKSLNLSSGGNREAAAAVGKSVAERSKAAGIEQVIFDRGGFFYHGRIKALADAAREGGLKF